MLLKRDLDEIVEIKKISKQLEIQKENLSSSKILIDILFDLLEQRSEINLLIYMCLLPARAKRSLISDSFTCIDNLLVFDQNIM